MCSIWQVKILVNKKKSKNSSWDKIICYHLKLSIQLHYYSNHTERFDGDALPLRSGRSDFRDNFLAHSSILLALLPICPFCDMFLSCLNTLLVLSVISILIAIGYLCFLPAGIVGQKDGLSQHAWLLRPCFKDDWTCQARNCSISLCPVLSNSCLIQVCEQRLWTQSRLISHCPQLVIPLTEGHYITLG